MLAAHPQLAIPPESHFVGYLARRYQDRAWAPAVLSALAADVAADAHFRLWGLDPESTAACVVASRPAGLADALGGFFSAYAVAEGKPYWGDKTPHHVFLLHDLERLWPDMRVLHVIRDGRDVACSHIALARDLDQRWTARSVPAAAAWWRAAIVRGRAAGARLGDRYAEVRYEDLLADPRRELDRLCRFAGLPFHADMLDHAGRVRTPRSPEFATARGPLRRPVHSWRGELSRHQIASFEAVAGPELAACGYEPAALPTDPFTDTLARARAGAFMGWRDLRRGARRAAHRHAVPLARAWARRASAA
jgi:Sulfotransferase family